MRSPCPSPGRLANRPFGSNIADPLCEQRRNATVGNFTLTGSGPSSTTLKLTSATLAFDLQGSGADLLTTNGAIALSGLSTISVSASGVLTASTYDIITASGGGMPASAGSNFQFANLSTSQTITSGGNSYLLTLGDDSTDLTLTVTPTPEPSTFILLATSAGALLLRRRKSGARANFSGSQKTN